MSLSGSLKIAELAVGKGGLLGIVACPGRTQVDGQGRRWQRHMETDFQALEVWGAEVLISLVEGHEFLPLGVPEFATAVALRDFHWCHLPIADMSIPGVDFNSSWKIHGGKIQEVLDSGGRLIIHCAGGLGRSGMIAAKLMTMFGTPPDEAIAQVRTMRPGAIETVAQEEYVRRGPVLEVPCFRESD